MTDDEILDECRRRFAKCAAMETPQKTVRQIIREAQERLEASMVWAPIDWANHVSDSGDETSPSEVNPQPIENVYAKIESEEEKRDRLWKAVVAASQG